MQIERGPGRGLSHAPPGPGWDGKQPKIDDFLPSPPQEKSKNPFDCIGAMFRALGPKICELEPFVPLSGPAAVLVLVRTLTPSGALEGGEITI